MWNDTDTPLAYLITFGCYGGWIHGYKRGSVDRFHNRYGSACLPPDLSRQRQIEALTCGLEKVTAQVQMTKPATTIALNNP